MNTSKGGIGSRWEFLQDGTLTMSLGVIVSSPYRLEGDALILSPETTGPGAKPQVITIRIEGDRLYERYGDSAKEMRFVRIKGGRPGDPPIVGQWRVDSSPADAQLSEVGALMNKNAVYTFTRDGTHKLRIPLRSIAGRYDTANQTFSLDQAYPKGQTKFTGQFELRDGKLYLTQPDGHTKDVYVRDDFE